MFPALAGALWWLFGQPEVAPRIARSIAGAVTTTYLTYAVARFARCRRMPLAPFLETVAAFGVAILPSAWGKHPGHPGRPLQT